MNVLALDTASPLPSVSLLWENVVSSQALSADRRSSEELLPAVAALLQRQGKALADFGRIAVCTGPGSFTGLRVGMATAWGLSRGSGVEVEGVSTLEALAEASRGLASHRVATALDAGRGEVIVASFDLAGPRSAVNSPPERMSREEARRRVRGMPLAAIPSDLLEIPSVPISAPLSAALAQAVARAPRSSGPLETTAIYSRPSAAEERHGAA
jgi:tRNA threonylcarbamoyl adenosine modification protein YeaZ